VSKEVYVWVDLHLRTDLYTDMSFADACGSHVQDHPVGPCLDRRPNARSSEVPGGAAGFVIDHVIADHGISGVSTALADRPEGKRLFDMLRRGDTLVVRWVDRLGRNYRDVSDTIREFMRRGVVIKTVMNRIVFDGATTDPMQQAVRDALIAFMAATAQAQAEANLATWGL
jgi:putative DNA-invertase from lambdoid prophage Rac